ncbi:MAG TPA: ABC transporter permease [Candidatus Dormibacteraeota bacterium]|jgi:oligopeptide transport system permease protein
MAAPAIALEQIDWENPEQIGLWKDAWQRFRRNPIAVLGLVIIGILVLIALLAPVMVALHLIADPLEQNVANSYASFSLKHPLGTDYLGRDLLSRVMYGARISLSLGILVQVVYLLIGGSIGLLSGYFGGRIDNLFMRFVDVWYAFPDLLFILVVMSILSPSLITLFLALGIVGWVDLARLIRGQTLSIKEKEYVEGARAAGSSPMKIILKHLLPNSLGPIIVSLTFGIPRVIFLEAVLSYLGVGIRPPTPSWGVMLQDGYQAIFSYPHQVFIPAVAIAITMLSFSFIGDGLRDALDPRMRR